MMSKSREYGWGTELPENKKALQVVTCEAFDFLKAVRMGLFPSLYNKVLLRKSLRIGG